MHIQNKYAWLVFTIILLAFASYAGLYIYKTSFVMEGERYFVLFDDAMISMQYAKNLANGYGLVWNPGGERVEGFTNPLWVFFMALFHLLPVALSKISLLIQISGAIFLLVNLVFVKLIADQLTGKPIVGLLAVLITAFYAPLITWGLLGMEVSLLTLIICMALWIALRSFKSDRFSPWLYIILGLGTLVRIDMAVPYLIILVVMLFADPVHRRQHLTWGFGSLILFIGGQTLLRLWYYGELLPNTYYLKMAGYPLVNRIKRGLYVLFLFGWYFNWILFLLPLTILLFRRDREVVLLGLVVLGQIAYSVYVGGDAWEHSGGANRYIAIVMPVLFLLIIYACWLIMDALLARLGKDTKWLKISSNLVLILFTLFAMFNSNVLIDFKSIERWVLVRRPEFTRGSEHTVRIAMDLLDVTTPEATVAVVTAGSIPYFSERYSIDLLGKSDPVIAREKPRHLGAIYNLDLFRPGHMKWNYDYSILQLKPDVITQIWGEGNETEPYLSDYIPWRGERSGQTIYLRIGSENILWERVSP